MEELEIKDVITDKTLAMVFFAVLIGSGTGPAFELLGYTHPEIPFLGAVAGAAIAVYEAKKVRERIQEAKDAALRAGGLAPGFSG